MKLGAFASQYVFTPLGSSSAIVFDLFDSGWLVTQPGRSTIGVPMLTVTGTSIAFTTGGCISQL